MIRLTSLVSPQVLGKPVNSKTSVVKENEEPEQNVANGLPQTQGDDKITMTRESLKNIVREVMKEEGEYQKIFHKLLNKFGVNSPAELSDEQKKKFFSLAKGVQTELKERMKIKEAELTGNQSKLDMDKDGDIEADDLAKLRAGKEANESVNESIMAVVGAIALGALGLELLASDNDGGMITKIIRDIKAKYNGEKTSAEAWEAVVKDYEIRKFVRNNANDIVKKGKNYKSKELEDLVQQKLNKKK